MFSTLFTGNPIASLISKLNLKKGKVTLQLLDDTIEASVEEKNTTNVSQMESNRNKMASFFDDDSSSEDEEDNKENNAKGRSQQTSKSAPMSTTKAMDERPQLVEVEIDLALSAHANARDMYAKKKIAMQKESKTV